MSYPLLSTVPMIYLQKKISTYIDTYTNQKKGEKKEKEKRKIHRIDYCALQCARHSIIVKAVKATRKRRELGLSSQDSAGSYSVLFASIGRRACAHSSAAATCGDGLQSFCLSLCLTTTRLYLLPPLLPRESESGTRPTQSGRPTSPSQPASLATVSEPSKSAFCLLRIKASSY